MLGKKADDPGAKGMSGTKLRMFAQQNDIQKFTDPITVPNPKLKRYENPQEQWVLIVEENINERPPLGAKVDNENLYYKIPTRLEFRMDS